MSKLDDLKKEIGWTKKAKQPFCSNCQYFSVSTKKANWGNHMVECDLRCMKYNFVTKKQATCKSHEFKQEN